MKNVATTLASHRAELATLETTIPRLHAELAVAEERRKELQVSISVCETFLAPSPFRGLPTETVGEIMCAYSDSVIPTQPEAEGMASSYEPSVPLAQLHAALHLPLRVCRRWSNIALSTPRYWKLQLLRYPAPETSAEDRANIWKRIEDCLERARNTPLYVIMCSMQSYLSEETATYDPEGMRLFAKCAQRVQTLVLPRQVKRDSMSMSSFLPDTHLPLLEKLILGPGHTLFAADPDIQTLKSLNSLSTIAPWEHTKTSSTITQLHIYQGTIHFFVICDILLGMPQLRDLRISYVIPGASPAPGTILRSHPSLRSLLGPNTSSFLHHFAFPNLRALELHSTDPWPACDEDFAFLKRSQCIDHLMLGGDNGFSEALPKALCSLPALRTVNLHGMLKSRGNPFPSVLLDAFAKKSRRQHPIPPHVVNFIFPEIPLRQMDRFQAALEGILAKREEYGALKYIGVDISVCGMEKFKEVIDRLAQAGIVVSDS